MEASEIRRLWILHSGEERLIENAPKAEVRPSGDSWTVHLVAPRVAFPRELEDGQLVRLRWESDGWLLEGYARMRVVGAITENERSDLRVQLEGVEAVRALETLSAEIERARVGALAQYSQSQFALKPK